MSTVRHFDGIPHIVRYGMQDEEKGESWTLFWRNAVCFTVKVSREDVQETPFGKRWRELNVENPTKVPGGLKRWKENWDNLCDCIITQSMPVLQELAPSTRQWKTLEDHLRTPAYDLKLIADQETGDAVAKVIKGPVERPSYEHHLMSFSDFQGLSDDLPRYQAQDLTCLGQGKDWRHPPTKVQTPTGEVVYFMTCNRRRKNVTTNEVTNTSVNLINANSLLHSKAGYREGCNIPKLLGVVVSRADREPEDWDGEGNQLIDTWPQDGIKTKEPLVAGVLLTYLSKAKTLADVMKRLREQIDAAEYAEAKKKWQAHLTLAVQHLHDHGIAIGGRSDPKTAWSYLNQHTVYIAPIDLSESLEGLSRAGLEAADAWLMVQTESVMCPSDTEQQGDSMKRFEEAKAMDSEALEKLFQF